MFLLSSKTHGTGEEENHLDKHYTYTKGEQQNFGNDVPRTSFPRLFFISVLYTNAHVHEYKYPSPRFVPIKAGMLGWGFAVVLVGHAHGS